MFFKKFYQKHKTGLTFMFFGLLTTIVDYFFYFILSSAFGRERMLDHVIYLGVNALSSFIAIVFAYVTNKLFVFRSKSWHWRLLLREIPSFFSTRLVALLISELGIWFLVGICGLSHFTTASPLFLLFSYAITGDIVAKFIMSFVSTALNFLFGKFLIFRERKMLRPSNGDESDKKRIEE